MFVSFFPNWKGQRQIRLFEIDKDRLHLGPDHPMTVDGRLQTASLIDRGARQAHARRRAKGEVWMFAR